MEELKKTIALLFKRKGSSQMTEKEFVFSASMDLRWFPPKDSQKLLEAAVSRGVVDLQDGQISPSFDISAVEIPLDFTPTPAVFDIPVKEDLFSKILDHMLATLDIERKEVISRINALQGKMEIEIEVAALLIGQELDVDISGFIPEVEKDILGRMKGGP